MLKALMLIAVYSIGVLLKKENFKTDTLLNMLSISFGVTIVAYDEARFNTWGVMLQLAAVAFEATRLVLIQILLTSKGISLNPITSLYYISPCCFIFLLVPWSLVELPILRASSSFRPNFLIFSTNSFCAFALNLAVFLLVGKTSALTMNVPERAMPGTRAVSCQPRLGPCRAGLGPRARLSEPGMARFNGPCLAWPGTVADRAVPGTARFVPGHGWHDSVPNSTPIRPKSPRVPQSIRFFPLIGSELGGRTRGP